MINSEKLHWTTRASEKVLLAVIGILTVVASIETVHLIYQKMTVSMADLFLLFIYAEIIGMVGAFYQSSRIPVTLPIIIAITALCRLVVLHSKEMDAMLLMRGTQYQEAAYLMSLKDKLSLEKIGLRND